MSDWEIKNLQHQLDRLDKKIWKKSTTNFIWLMILSNIIFWLFISNIDLRRDLKIAHMAPQHEQMTSDVQKKE